MPRTHGALIPHLHEPTPDTLRVVMMPTQRPHIDVIIQTDGALLFWVDQVWADLVDVVVLEVDYGGLDYLGWGRGVGGEGVDVGWGVAAHADYADYTEDY